MDASSLITSASVVLAIVGTTESVKQFRDSGFVGVITPLVAAALGLLAGYGHLLGLSPIQGVFFGLAAVGSHTLAGQLGGTSPSVPEQPVTK
jgi:Kef-type K+ transport system membrane component KefB